MPDLHADRIRERFNRETSGHRLTVLRDEGLYRHLRSTNPQYGALYGFDLITWPNGLLIRGDGPNFVFALHPTADLFEMFRGSSSGGINPGYWKEKVRAGQVKAWSEELFRTWLVKAARAEEARHPGLGAAVRSEILDNDEHSLEFEEGARYAVGAFEYKGYRLRYPAKWERDFDDWSWEYLWACHAILRGIAEYDRAKAAAPPADQPLRDRIAEAIRTDLKKAIPPLETYPGGHQLGGLGRTEYDLADVALAELQPELDRARAELASLTAAAETVHAELHALVVAETPPGAKARAAWTALDTALITARTAPTD